MRPIEMNMLFQLTRPMSLSLIFVVTSISIHAQAAKSKLNAAKRRTASANSKSDPSNVTSARPNLAKEPTLYAVAYAHHDTEWRWEYPQVTQEYLTKTMRNNFALFEKYPHYIFNFTGANLCRLMKEYYPADFDRLKFYVSMGRWFPAGSSMEEGDVNSPNAESIIRQILYGNNWFRK